MKMVLVPFYFPLIFNAEKIFHYMQYIILRCMLTYNFSSKTDNNLSTYEPKQIRLNEFHS